MLLAPLPLLLLVLPRLVLAWTAGPVPRVGRSRRLSAVEDEQRPGPSHRGRRPGPSFARTDREEGRRQLLVAVSRVAEAGDPGEAVALSKTLLYSGIPELALELYALSFDALSALNSSAARLVDSTEGPVPVIADGRLLLVVYRSLLALGRVGLLGAFLEAAALAGVAVDDSSLNLLVAELATVSDRGLEVALRVPQLFREFRLNTNGYAGLLRGIRLHGMGQVGRNEDFVAPPGHNCPKGDGTPFRLDPAAAERMAIDFVSSHVEHRGKSAISPKVLTEALRIVFRVAAMSVKDVLDSNFETDVSSSNAMKADMGLVACLAFLRRFKETWSIHVADSLLEECLTLGDIEGVRFVARQMRRRGLFARTSTLNLALQLYAANGDAESALQLLNDTMKPSDFCKPDVESYGLLITSCMLTRRGLFLAGNVANDMLQGGFMDKRNWNKFVDYTVLSRGPWLEAVRAMSYSGFQPDDETVYFLLRRFNDCRMVEEALMVFDLQLTSRLFPPPSPRSLSCLLEILWNFGLSEKAVDVLERVCEASHSNDNLSAGRQFLLLAARPDCRAFAVAMEACITQGDSDSAFKVFQLMERMSISPSRRIYAALIRAFGLRGDIYSSIGVFKELIQKFVFPDVVSLNALLSVAKVNPPDLRLCVPILEELTAQGVNLEIFSRDVIMHTFENGNQLGAALQLMLAQEVPEDCVKVEASFSVLSCLAQALRTGDGIDYLLEALLLIARSGISPDASTIDYFTIPPLPERNSPGSRYFYNAFLPNQSKKRSVLNIDIPYEWITDLNSPKDPSSDLSSAPIKDTLYFEKGEDPWSQHVEAILASMSDSVVTDTDDVHGGMVAEDMVRIFDVDLKPALDSEEKLLDSNRLRTRVSKRAKRKKEVRQGSAVTGGSRK